MKRILVIGNDPATRDPVANLFKGQGHRVVVKPVSTRITYATLPSPPSLVIFSADHFLSKKEYGALCDVCEYAKAIGNVPVLLQTDIQNTGILKTVIVCGVSDCLPLAVSGNERLFVNKVAHWMQQKADLVLEKSLPGYAREAMLVTSATFTDVGLLARSEMPLPFLTVRGQCNTFLQLMETSKEGPEALRAFAIRSGDDADLFFHLMRVGFYLGMFGPMSGYEGRDFFDLISGGYLHDGGKLLTPLEILNHPGKLEGEWWEIMQRHSRDSARMLLDAKDISQIAIEIALLHHEKWDGTGYPQGLKGTAIPKHVRLATIADVFDALTSRRSYKAAMTKQEALEVMRCKMRGHFDPELFEMFRTMILAHSSSFSAVQNPVCVVLQSAG